MNELNQMNLGLFAGLNAMPGTSAFPNVGGMGEAPQGGQAGFENLLDLVGDAVVADEQSAVLDESLAQAMQNIQVNPLEMQKQQAIGALTPEALEVGQPVEPVETKASSEVSVPPMMVVAPQNFAQMQALPSFALNAQGAAVDGKVSAPVNAMAGPALKPESVQVWGMALAAGDITKVEVGAEAELPKAEEFLSQDFMRPEASVAPSLAPKKTLSPELSGAHAVKLNEIGRSVDALKAEAPAGNGFQAMNLQAVELPKSEEVSVVKSKGKKLDNAVTASDFVLDRLGPAAESAEAAPALFEAHSLGETSDRRISPEALNFVANKVDNLKAQGGGVLRVELNPNGLGQLEIKVTNRKSGLEVQLIAANPETLRALKSNEAQLTQKLQEIAPTRLDVSHVSGATSVDTAKSLSGKHPEAAMPSSQELLVVRELAAKGAEVHSAVADLSRASSNSSLATKLSNLAEVRTESVNPRQEQSALSGQSWSRDERREQARNRWEEFYEGMRQSA